MRKRRRFVLELTISQIGSASPHWIARYAPAVNADVRTLGTSASCSADMVAAVPVASLGDLETEYDQFGRFGVTAGNAADIAETTAEHRPAINATKHFRSGEVTAGELEQEYARSLLDSAVGTDGETAARRFIPAFMTEYQVYQLYDFQYRWAIEVERRVLVRMQDMEPPRSDSLKVAAVARGSAASGPHR